MNNDLENLTKALHSIKLTVADLKRVIQTDNLLLLELAMTTLKNLSEEELKISRLIKILETSNQTNANVI